MKKWEIVTFIILLSVFSISSISESLFYFSVGPDTVGGPFHNISTICLYLIEVIALFKLPSRLINNTNKLNWRILLWSVYAFIITLLTTYDLLFDLRRLLWWPSVYYLSYLTAISYSKTTGFIIEKWFPFLFVSICVIYIYIRIAHTQVFDGLYVTSNDVFYISLFIPLLLLISSKKKRFILLSIALILTIISFKRTAIITVSVCFILTLLAELRKRQFNFSSKVFILFLFIVVFVGAFVLVNKNTEGYVTERFETASESGGSGRTRIYQLLLQKYSESSIIEKTFGIGFNGVKKKYNIANESDQRLYSAHSDFLEMLVDYGALGLMLYLLIILRFLQMIKVSKQHYPQLTLPLQAGFWTYFIMCCFSHMFIYPSFHAFIMAFYGIANGMIYKHEKYDFILQR